MLNWKKAFYIIAFIQYGCKQGPSVHSGEVDKACGSGLVASEQEDMTLQGSYGVTFYKDIYPIVTSSKSGEAYKCATCHASYFDPQGLANVSEIEMAVAAMRSGRMPPQGGDRVKEEYIQKFIEWRLTGFAVGDRSQIPVNTIDPSVYTSSDCL